MSRGQQEYAEPPRSPLPPPPLPPPPPPISASNSAPLLGPSAPLQTSPLRRIAVQPPIITTALAPPPQGASFLQTPASATSLSVPFSPYAPSPSTYAASPVSSPMAMRTASSVPYNPQQWGRQGPTGGVHVPHTMAQSVASSSRAMDITGMEASMPSPPPPYSPAQNPSISQSVSQSPHIASHAFSAPQNTPISAHPTEYDPSRPISGFVNSRPGSMLVPQSATSVTSNHQFPPPPPRNPGERSVSRDKSHSKFSLSAFRNRNSESSPKPTAIEALRINTTDAISRVPGSPSFPPNQTSSGYMSNGFADSPIRPPASRRAVSAGFVETRTPIEQSPTPVQGMWGSSMSIPPPPPGPPPSSSRSQSLGPRGMDPQSSRTLVPPPAPPTRRPGQTSLTPIPPTPIGWQEDQARNRSRSPASRGLFIDTSSEAIQQRAPPAESTESGDVSVSSGPTASTSNSTLYRAPAKRDTSARGIRERRSESRAARERAEPSNNPWAQDLEAASSKPAELVISTRETSLSRRGAVSKNTPRSGGAIRSPRSSKFLDGGASATSTPRTLNDSRQLAAGFSAPTPPFSPGTDTFESSQPRPAQTALPSKALPTPPFRYYSDDLGPDLTNDSGAAKHSTSETAYLSDARPEESSLNTPRPVRLDSFAQAAIERHRHFIEKELTAQSDTERLELFAEFIVTESRLRRDRYSTAFDAMAGDVFDLTRDLWRSYGNAGRRSVTPSAHSATAPSGRRSQASTYGDSPDTRFSNSVPTTAASPASSVANLTPHTEPPSPSGSSSQRHRDPAWNNNFQPCLSPIPSMAMSTVPDEEDSRGRSASRWWEASNDGASSGYGRRLERSKRESKYMGLPKEARESLQWGHDHQGSPAYRSGSRGVAGYGPDEYPPEKVGLHEEDQSSSAYSHGYRSSPAPTTPDPLKLDVSRLVTLPPPYPRHHPAVNNNHPDLASIRNNLRALSDFGEAKSTKERFKMQVEERKKQDSTSYADQKAQLRHNIQENVRNGIMTFADAANAEADFEAREDERAQKAVQTTFDTFQTEVANPLHALFCERITKVSASLEYLKGRLSSNAQEINPNQTQEEGDEQPELLEMLTLLKWLFEAREQLYKEMFELEDERNDLYKDIIVLPYIQNKNEQKVKEATAFFARDGQDRKVVFEKEILKRYEDFLNVVETNVTRGVEAQLSAFWDIAPGLLAVVQSVPTSLKGFNIVIPPREFEETPIYHQFPLQYLYTVLSHAGRSAYQFIESQTNLLCLLHEVKTGVMTASSRLLETQRALEGEDAATIDCETRSIRADEERRLTDDLKDKVGLVESQWDEALGRGLEECKHRVEAFLVNQGGWDDSLKE